MSRDSRPLFACWDGRDSSLSREKIQPWLWILHDGISQIYRLKVSCYERKKHFTHLLISISSTDLQGKKTRKVNTFFNNQHKEITTCSICTNTYIPACGLSFLVYKGKHSELMTRPENHAVESDYKAIQDVSSPFGFLHTFVCSNGLQLA